MNFQWTVCSRDDYRADSLRYSLVTGVTPGQDIPLNMDKIAANRQFANKLWNICKFVTENALKNADEETIQAIGVDGPMLKDEFDSLSLPEKYIVSKCHELVESVTADIEKYQFIFSQKRSQKGISHLL